jgi:hypothetical protein
MLKTEECNILADIEYIEIIVRKMAQLKGACFSSEVDKQRGMTVFCSTRLGKSVLSLLKVSTVDIEVNYPLHKFNPYVEAFIRCVKLYFPYKLPWWLELDSDREVLEVVECLNRLVGGIRVEINSPEFKKAIAKYDRSTNKNYKELGRYIDGLFVCHSRMLVLRVDFSYLNKYSGHAGVECSVGYEDVKSHREQLFKYLRKYALKGSLVGFAWKLEYGLDKGYHYHVLLFLDGSKVCRDVAIARGLGEHWSTVITGGKGLYFNCNAQKESYKYCGIGMINHGDQKLRDNLRKAAIYLTKVDYYKKIVVPGNDRTFGKGVMPKSVGVKRGRPRSASSVVIV